MIWEQNDNYLMGTTKDFILTNKLAMFDLDGTLIHTKSGKKFPMDQDDYKLGYGPYKSHYHESDILKELQDVFDKLTELGYTTIIISNQKGLLRSKQNIDEWKDKIEDIQFELDIPLLVCEAMKDDKYRKQLDEELKKHDW